MNKKVELCLFALLYLAIGCISAPLFLKLFLEGDWEGIFWPAIGTGIGLMGLYSAVQRIRGKT